MPLFVRPQRTPVPVGILDGIEACSGFETGKPCLFACLQSSKKRRKRLVQAAQGVLQAGRIRCPERLRVCSAHVAEINPLSIVTNLLSRFLENRHTLFKCVVVRPSVLLDQAVEQPGLANIRAKEVFVHTKHWLTGFLCLNVSFDGFLRHMTYRANVGTSAPHVRKAGAQLKKLLAHHPGWISFALVCTMVRRFGGITFKKYVNMIWRHFQRLNDDVPCFSLLGQQGMQFIGYLSHQYVLPILRTPNQVVFQGIYAPFVVSLSFVAYRTIVLLHSTIVNYLTERRKACFLCRLQATKEARDSLWTIWNLSFPTGI